MKTSPEKRDRLKNLTATLARIHKALLELQMHDLEVASGVEIKPAARLNLLLGDKDFAWLRNLSQLMAIADDVYFQKEEISNEQMQKIKVAVTDLFIIGGKKDFSDRYSLSCQRLTSVMLEHAKIVATLKEF